MWAMGDDEHDTDDDDDVRDNGTGYYTSRLTATCRQDGRLSAIAEQTRVFFTSSSHKPSTDGLI